MRFVVTGGAGFVGSHLVKLLVREGHQVKVIDNLHTGKMENLEEVIEDIEFCELDIQDFDSMEKELRDSEGVFHQAALTVVQDSFRIPDKYHNVNVDGTENIFKIAQKNNFKVVYASSSSVYGHQDIVPILENFEKNQLILMEKQNWMMKFLPRDMQTKEQRLLDYDTSIFLVKVKH